jgi:hypothetical protein
VYGVCCAEELDEDKASSWGPILGNTCTIPPFHGRGSKLHISLLQSRYFFTAYDEVIPKILWCTFSELMGLFRKY